MPNACRYFGCLVLSVYLVFFLPSILSGQSEQGKGLHLERIGIEQVYFSYNGKPLLPFGTKCDFIFYLDKLDYDSPSPVPADADGFFPASGTELGKYL